MAKKETTFTKDTEVLRSVKLVKDGEETAFAFQPYICGVYVAVSVPGRSMPDQGGLDWRGFKKMNSKFESDMKKRGYEVTVTRAPLGNFLKEEEIEEYVNSK